MGSLGMNLQLTSSLQPKAHQLQLLRKAQSNSPNRRKKAKKMLDRGETGESGGVNKTSANQTGTDMELI